MAAISFKAVCKSFADTHVIRGIDLEAKEGEFLVFVGPSGCGKSTMLRMIAGLESITSGDMLIDGVRVNDLSPAARGAAMVFQSYALYPHMTVEENMGFGLRMAGMPKAQVKTEVRATAETLQIIPLLDRYPKQLSGGQRQRVAIGRAIVRRPKVFLFDEPLSNLDASLRVQLRIELARLHEKLKTTMIYVTHDQTEAMTLGDRIAIFNQGRIEQIGAPLTLYKKPANRFVAEFLGSPKINMLPFKWQGSGQQLKIGADVCVDAAMFGLSDSSLRDGAVLGIRPEHFDLDVSGQGIPAQVDLIEYLGDSTVIYARIPGLDDVFTVKLAQQQVPVASGMQIGLKPVKGEVLVFTGEGLCVDAVPEQVLQPA
ncbi:MAG: sn-glycerol-3-phosphate ABC transporter ATP-binding protein UgpC [Pseudomonadota bacterium]